MCVIMHLHPKCVLKVILNNKKTILMPTQVLISLHYKERRVDLWRRVRYENADVSGRQTSSNQYSLFTQIVFMH